MCLERRGLLPPLLLFLFLLSLSCPQKRRKDGRQGSGKRILLKKEQQQCRVQSDSMCVLIRRAAMSVRCPSSCPSLLPPSLSFLPSPLSLYLLLVFLFPLFCSSLVLLGKLCDTQNTRLLMHSVFCLCLCVSSFLLWLSNWLYQAFCSSAQQQSIKQAGMFHSAQAQGCWFVTETGK